MSETGQQPPAAQPRQVRDVPQGSALPAGLLIKVNAAGGLSALPASRDCSVIATLGHLQNR